MFITERVFVSKIRVQIAAAIGVSESKLGTKRNVLEIFRNLGQLLKENKLTLTKVIDKFFFNHT